MYREPATPTSEAPREHSLVVSRHDHRDPLRLVPLLGVPVVGVVASQLLDQQLAWAIAGLVAGGIVAWWRYPRAERVGFRVADGLLHRNVNGVHRLTTRSPTSPTFSSIRKRRSNIERGARILRTTRQRRARS